MIVPGAVVVATLALGAVHLPVMEAVGLVLLLGVLRLAWQHRRFSAVFPVPAQMALAVAAFSLVQACPLPLAWVSRLSPAAGDVWSLSLAPFGERVTWASLSLDPGASCVEALRWASYGAAFALASHAARKEGAAFGPMVAFFCAALAAVVTVAHGLAGATKVYGLYAPSFSVLPWHVGPLLNPNNLAGYLNVGAMCGMGLLLSRRPRLPAWLTGTGLLLIVAVDVTTGSRGGLMGLVLGGIALVIVYLRKPRRVALGSKLALASVLLGAIVFALLGAQAGTKDELFDTSNKLGMWLWVKPIVADYPVFGIGRGAFESVFPAYAVEPGSSVYTHAENVVTQWASEWGLIVTVPLLFGFAWCLRPTRLGVQHSTLLASAWVGIWILLIQNLADLGLEIPAVMLLLCLVWGSLWGGSRESAVDSSRSRSRRRHFGAILLSGAAILALAGVWGRHDVDADRRECFAIFGSTSASPAQTWSALEGPVRQAIRRHPAEPYFPLVAAMTLWRSKQGDPMPFLERTLERNRMNGRGLLLLAQVLREKGALSQGMLSLRQALESDPGLVLPVARLAASWTNDYDALARVVPAGSTSANVSSWIAECLPLGIAREHLDADAIARDPSAIEPRLREASDLLASLEASSPRCLDRTACLRSVADYAAFLEAHDLGRSVGVEMRARMLAADGKADEASDLLDAACDHSDDRVRCLTLATKIAARVKGGDRFAETSKRLAAVACTEPSRCANTHVFLGDLCAQRGEVALALAAYRKAAIEEPREDVLDHVASAAVRAGAHVVAAEALDKLVAKWPTPERRKSLDAERTAATALLP